MVRCVVFVWSDYGADVSRSEWTACGIVPGHRGASGRDDAGGVHGVLRIAQRAGMTFVWKSLCRWVLAY